MVFVVSYCETYVSLVYEMFNDLIVSKKGEAIILVISNEDTMSLCEGCVIICGIKRSWLVVITTRVSVLLRNDYPYLI